MSALRVLLVLPLLAFAGCAADDAAPTPTTSVPTPPTGGNATGPAELFVNTTGTYPVNPGFGPASLEVPAGMKVKVTFRNAETAPIVAHDWVLEGVEGAAVASQDPGQTGTVEFDAPAPGEYAYFCSIGDHRERGMEGTLTVKAA